ncbi:Otolin 1 [Mactra antiquata]
MALCLFIQAYNARTISMEDLLVRIENLESWKSDTEKEIKTLREVVKKQEAIIEKQARILETYADDTPRYEPVSEDSVKQNASNNENEVSVIDSRTSPVGTHTVTRQRPYIRQTAEGVAFTAYLTHGVDTGDKQTIKFDQVIINDGNGYNVYTGAFTCPQAGVYLFSFFLGQRGLTESERPMSVRLVKNDDIIVSGTVETRHVYQDLQGGNMAVVRLNLGDVVWVETFSNSVHVEGDDTFRLTTFSGVYLYA